MKDLPFLAEITASELKEIEGGRLRFLKRIFTSMTIENGNTFERTLTITPEESVVQEREICPDCVDENSQRFNALVQSCNASGGGLSSCTDSNGNPAICCDF